MKNLLVMFMAPILGSGCVPESAGKPLPVTVKPIPVNVSGPESLPLFPKEICNQTWSNFAYLLWLVENDFLVKFGGHAIIPLDDNHTMYLSVATKDNSSPEMMEFNLREKAESHLARAILGTNHRTTENHETRGGRKIVNGIEDANYQHAFERLSDNRMNGDIPAYDLIGTWSAMDAGTDFYAIGSVVKNDGTRIPFGTDSSTNPFLRQKKASVTRTELQIWCKRSEENDKLYCIEKQNIEKIKISNKLNLEKAKEKAIEESEKLVMEKERKQKEIEEAVANEKQKKHDDENKKIEALKYQHQTCIHSAAKLENEYRQCLVNLRRVHFTMEPQVRNKMFQLNREYQQLFMKDCEILEQIKKMEKSGSINQNSTLPGE